MRQVLGDTLRRLGVDEESVADILLAASEACTNVVLHAGQSVRAYEVTAFVNGRDCNLEVRDDGNGCRMIGRRGRGQMAESGRGFAVMRGSVDGVTLRSAPGRGTRVVLHKRIRWNAPMPIPA